jgi:hypothetical protein
MSELDRPIMLEYNKAVEAVAKELARERGLGGTRPVDANNARRILWPVLSASERNRATMRGGA